MITRKIYLDLIRPFIGKPVIKAITGVRRCGKSTLLTQIADELRNKDIADERIIFINKELFEFDDIKNYKELHKYILSKSKKIKTPIYVFIDEIQEISEWERSVASFLAEKKYDLFIAGSNEQLLSSELAKLLSGRYVEFRMNTFTLNEFILISNESKQEMNIKEHFNRFIKYGGFPGIHLFEWNENAITQYLHSLYSTILLKDIISRYPIRDVTMLEQIVHFLANNAGNITTAKNISDFVKSQHKKLAVETVQNYIQYCINAILLQKVRRYDLRGKRILETHEKYFFSDVGLLQAIHGYTPDNISGRLENIVFLELITRGYMVTIGKLYDKEVDFIATRGNNKLYIQVCVGLNGTKVIEREYGSLQSIDDHYPKFVLSLDEGFETSQKGIQWMNIRDFLMEM